MIHKKWFIFLLVLLAPLIAFAEQYESMRIAKIDVIAENISQDRGIYSPAVRAKLCSKVGNLFSQIEFDCDLKALAEAYDRVEPEVDVINNEIHIVIHIWTKPTIGRIDFFGNDKISTKKLKKELGIEEGSILDRSTFIQAFNKIKTLYVKKGYFEAELDYRIVPIENGNNEVDVLINIDEGRSGKIKSLRFEGFTPREEADISDMLLTKKYNILLSWYTGTGVYHPEMMEHDRMQIVNFLQNRGYADAEVWITLEELENSNRIELVIRAEKGVLYSFGTVSFFGNTLFPNERIWEAIQINPCDVYSPELIRNTVKAITDLYGEHGYIDTVVDIQLSLQENCPVYDVNIAITEGIQYYVGLIRVFGNVCTQTKVILHESVLCPGEVFDNRQLEVTEARLCNTGFFKNVNVYAVRSQLEDPCGFKNYRDIYIEVVEDQTGNIGLFGGFSTQDRIFGGFEITERNFNIAGIPQILIRGPGAIRGAGEYAHARINIGNRQTSYLFQWTKPYFLDTPWILGIDFEKTNNRALSKAYEVKTYGGSIHGIYILNPFLKSDIYYRARHTHNSIRDDKNVKLEEEAKKAGFISAVGAALMYDSTDHPRRPCSGLRSRLLYEFAGVGGPFHFMKFGYFNSYYYPLSKKGTLKFRLDMQFIKTYGSTNPRDIPLSERFFLGGEGTVRGYRPYIIGPKFGNLEPSGGVSSYLISEEYQHNLLTCPMLDAFVFVDAGYVSMSEFTVGKPAASVGFGIRIEIMRNVPLMMGLGWPIHPTEKLNGHKLDVQQRFFFSMGGCF